MTTSSSLPAVLTDGVALLERSMSFTLGGLLLVTPAALRNPTPCAAWDLRDLLLHMNESLRGLHEAIAAGHLELDPAADVSAARADYGDPTADPVTTLKNRACTMVGAWVGPGAPRSIAIADRPLTSDVVAAAGAVEVAVHGWDVARACGDGRPVPTSLAEELLALCAVFVDDGDRPHRFGPAVEVAPRAPAGDRLVALLGREPH
jgi:uncharacterized protein (TIGR03086 family)